VVEITDRETVQLIDSSIQGLRRGKIFPSVTIGFLEPLVRTTEPQYPKRHDDQSTGSPRGLQAPAPGFVGEEPGGFAGSGSPVAGIALSSSLTLRRSEGIA